MSHIVLGIRKDFFQNLEWPTANVVCETPSWITQWHLHMLHYRRREGSYKWCVRKGTLELCYIPKKVLFTTSLDEPNETMEKIGIPTIAARSEDFPLSKHECQPFHHTLQVYRTSENIFQFSDIADRKRQAVNLRLPKHTPITFWF